MAKTGKKPNRSSVDDHERWLFRRPLASRKGLFRTVLAHEEEISAMQSVVDVGPGQHIEAALDGFLDIDSQSSSPGRRAVNALSAAYSRPSQLFAPESPVLFIVGIGAALSAGVALAFLL